MKCVLGVCSSDHMLFPSSSGKRRQQLLATFFSSRVLSELSMSPMVLAAQEQNHNNFENRSKGRSNSMAKHFPSMSFQKTNILPLK